MQEIWYWHTKIPLKVNPRPTASKTNQIMSIIFLTQNIRIQICIHRPNISSCHAISMDIPDPLSPPLPIVHCFRQVFRTRSRIGTELMYVGSSWSSCLFLSMWRGPQEYITYELVPTSPAVFCMSGFSNFNSFRDGWYSCCFVGCCLLDLFNIACSILV